MFKTIPRQIFTIFKNGSKTYFYSSLFFPNEVKADVFALYSFVRTADDFVDQSPPQTRQFRKFRLDYEQAIAGKSSRGVVIDSFIELQRRRDFDSQWVRSFLDAMELDLKQKSYTELKDTVQYMYGSAEVIGLMMSKILDLPQHSYSAAQSLGRSMQYVNFIRDIQEDNELGRVYFPQHELKKHGLVSLEKKVAESHPSQFNKFIQAQITQYQMWCNEGEQGFAFIPLRYLIPIKTASDLYKWTALEIAKRPMVVYERKLKPTILRILYTLLKNSLWSLCR